MTFLFTTALIIVVVFFLLTIAVFFDSPSVHALDTGIAEGIARFKTHGWSVFWNWVTFFGGVVGIPLASLLVILFTQFDTTIIVRGVVAVGGSALIVQILKILIARIRPEKLPWRPVELEFSYPSGHTTAATALYGFIAVLLDHTSVGFLGLAVAVFVILCIAFSRMALSVHHASDILGGLLLGVLGIIAAYILV